MYNKFKENRRSLYKNKNSDRILLPIEHIYLFVFLCICAIVVDLCMPDMAVTQILTVLALFTGE